jgi:hypothetical protein
MNFVSPSSTDHVDCASERGSAIKDAADEIERMQRICRILVIAWRLPNGSKAIGAPGSYCATGIIALRGRVDDLVVGAAA